MWLNYFNINPIFTICLVIILSLIVGSFLNVVIYRLPKILEYQWQLATPNSTASSPGNLFFPRSYCPHCKTQIKFYDNIPLLSYLILKGNCRSCQKKIPLQYFLVEGLTVALALLAISYAGFSPKALGIILFMWLLLPLAWIDAQHYYLPDQITLPGIWLGLILNLQNMFTSIDSAIYGAILGYLSLWIIYWLFKMITGKEGLGYGDFKLTALLGAWLGWECLLPTIVIAAILGLFGASLGNLFQRKKLSQPLPFGPYLASAGVFSLFMQTQILNLLW